jgi:PST family polysaccharide transporter
MNLLKTSFYSATITLIKVASGFVSNKIVAVLIGPAGIALIGQFANLISMVQTFGNGAINTGVVKYTAEYDGDRDKEKLLYSTSVRITILCSLFVGALLILFASYVSSLILLSLEYSGCIRLFGGTIVLYSLNNLLLSILNGKREIKKYTIVNTIGSIISLLFTIVLVLYFKLYGALYAMILSQSVVVFVSVTMIVRCEWFKWANFRAKFDKLIAKKLANFGLMAVVSAIMIPVSQMFLRDHIIKIIGINEAGYWQGMMRISDAYLMIVTTSLSTYYLPKLSSINTDGGLRKEILYGYKIILPFVAIGCLIIYICRFYIIEILFSPVFLKMEDLFIFQLLGDFFKIAAWILAYLLVAKAMTKLFVIVEVVSTITYLLLSVFFVHYIGIKGVVFAFFINYAILFIWMLFLFRKIMFRTK